MTLNSYQERRQQPRFSVKLPLDYWQTPEVIQGGLVANISETGLLIHCVHKIQTGTILGIRVYLSIDNRLDCIEGKAKIVWMNLFIEKKTGKGIDTVCISCKCLRITTID